MQSPSYYTVRVTGGLLTLGGLGFYTFSNDTHYIIPALIVVAAGLYALFCKFENENRDVHHTWSPTERGFR